MNQKNIVKANKHRRSDRLSGSLPSLQLGERGYRRAKNNNEDALVGPLPTFGSGSKPPRLKRSRMKRRWQIHRHHGHHPFLELVSALKVSKIAIDKRADALVAELK
jgi:hypothetical protein